MSCSKLIIDQDVSIFSDADGRKIVSWTVTECSTCGRTVATRTVTVNDSERLDLGMQHVLHTGFNLCVERF